MLILSRKPGQFITIQPEAGVDVSQPVDKFFSNHPIEVYVTNIDRGEVKLGISAHRSLNIVRGELLPKHQCVDGDVCKNTRYGQARQHLAVNIYNYRLNHQWTINEMAVLTRIPIHVLMTMENGASRVNLEDLEVIAEVFDVGVAGLFE